MSRVPIKQFKQHNLFKFLFILIIIAVTVLVLFSGCPSKSPEPPGGDSGKWDEMVWDKDNWG